MKYRGVDYYAEAWPEERWDEDIRMMSEAKINMVKIGVFSWARLEPEEGVYDLEWFKRLADKISEAGIRLFVGTPTAAPPAWLTSKCQEVLNYDENATRVPHGLRRHYCPTSPLYREFCAKIVDEIAKSVSGNKMLAAWQIDNEIAIGETGPCYCAQCKEAFREWLKKKYGSLAALNNAWNTVFWSCDFSEWEQIVPPFPRPAWQLDYIRFQSDAFRDFIGAQIQIIRKYDQKSLITTNSWIGLNAPVDAVKIFESLDVASYDCYINYHGSLQTYRASLDLYRNLKEPSRPFWIAETGAWNCVTAEDDSLSALRAWAYEFIARGADAMLYFRWRQSVMGEEDHPAILNWSGRKTSQYEKVKELFAELDSLSGELENLPLPQAQVAIIWDPQTALLNRIKDGDYMDNVIMAHSLMDKMNIACDILPLRDSLDIRKYNLLILPQLEKADRIFAAKLESFISDGGVVLAQTRLAISDENGKYLPETSPVFMHELFGIEINERWNISGLPRYGPVQFVRDSARRDEPEVSVDFCFSGLRAKGVKYMEALEILSDDVEILAEYSSGALKGRPAVAMNKHGKGFAFYQGCWMDEKSSLEIIKRAAEKAGINYKPDIPEAIAVLKRGRIRFYINNSNKACNVKLEFGGDILVGQCANGVVELGPYDVCLMKEE